MTKTRSSAVACLAEILKKEGRPKQVLEQSSVSLDRRDRAFIMEIVYGVLRNLYVLDWIIGTFVKSTKQIKDQTINNLRIALYQILFMRVPDFAVVYEAVEIEKDRGKPSLVNAVLRNIIRNKENIRLPIPIDDPVKDISINTSHQPWMVKRWIERYGIDETRSLTEANNSIPPLVLRTNTLRIARNELLRRLAEAEIGAQATRFSPDGIVMDRAFSFQDLAAFQGLFSVQDEASQMIGFLLSPQQGERILDACAAPGGKTTHLAQLMQDKGEIIAIDKDDHRLGKLQENIRSHGIESVRVIRADIGAQKGLGTFDRILLDAPCSSTGVIRRNPDVKYRHTRQDIITFGKKQANLLRAVAPLLRDGGKIVYSVCSIEPEEGEHVIQDFLKTSGEFRIIDADQEFMTTFMRNGFFRTFPHKHTMDGFFGALLCKAA
jgi:16S rRNA (cytosine967-C5)-methyltransferase